MEEYKKMLIKSKDSCHYNFWPDRHVGSAVGSFDLFDNKNDPSAPLELWSFGIREEEQGKGYGQQMLNEAIAMAGDLDIVLYVYKTNFTAIRIYEKAGFEITGKYHVGNFAWKMTRVANKSKSTNDCALCCA